MRRFCSDKRDHLNLPVRLLRQGRGGLISYGFDPIDQFRWGGLHPVRTRYSGGKPADLPVQYPTKFEIVVNLKTANALGLEVPLQLQQLADEVIE